MNQTGSPVTLAIAADNRFSVSVNGTNVSTNNSETNFYSPQNVDITSAIHQGSNTLAITVDNIVNPATTGTIWASNPAGLDYKVTQNWATLASSDGTEQSSGGSTIVIPQSKILYSWTSIPGASWIWDSALYNSSISQASCNGYVCTTTQQPTSQPPVISGGTFPTTLTVGQTGTWAVNASDPQNGSLSYSVNWGDNGSACPVGYVCANSASLVVQNSTFTHSYASAGNYTITFSVTDSAGLSAQTTTTVNVTATPVACPAGYVCTPPGQTTTCPSGYTCTGVTSNCPPSYTCSTQTQTPPSAPVSYANVPPQVITFTKTFNLTSTTSPVSLSIAADNGYSVSVNGIPVASGDVNATNFTSPKTYDITSAVNQGSNTIAITVTNIPNPSIEWGWWGNPAGVDYTISSGGSIIASSDGTEQSSGGSTLVIPSNNLYRSWARISGANWIWDSSLFNSAQYTCPVAGQTWNGSACVGTTSYNFQTSLSASVWNAVQQYLNSH